MVDTQELRTLTRWCAARGLQWQPARSENDEPAILLRSVPRRRAWSEMILVAVPDGFSLLDAAGEVAATASDLPALLDALDAGLACGVPPIGLTPYMARSSALLWNRSGSAST